MEILNVNSNKGMLTVKWSDSDRLANYVTPQCGCFFQNISGVNWASALKFNPLFKQNFHSWMQNDWTFRENLSMFDLPENSKIIDIGSGASTIDLLLYSYLPNSTFYLVDKDGEWPDGLPIKDISYSESHPFYNSWSIVLDAIETSNFDRNRFNFLSPTDEFPEEVDLIMSSASWCFHYSKDQYWDRVMKSLKVGGKLFLDVRLLPDRDIIGEISEALKSEPIKIKLPELPQYLDVRPTIEDCLGYHCLWINNCLSD